MTYVLLDTNIYLHCVAFDTLPWKDIVGAEDEVAILLPMQVLRELDKKKDDASEKAVHRRAKKVCAKLSDILLDEKESSPAVITCEMPPRGEFKPGFLLEVSDDVILMSAISFQSKNTGRVVVVSRDIPMLMKAKQANLDFVKMPDQYLLPSDQEDKEKQQLREELRRLKSRLPAPKLVFEDKSEKLRLKRYVPQEPVVDESFTEDESEFYLLQEESKASHERFHEIELYVFNGGTAPTGDFTVQFDLSKLKTCRTSIETVSMIVPKLFQTEEERNRNMEELEEWEEKEPVRYFSIFHKDDAKEAYVEFERECDSITQGLKNVVFFFTVDLYEAESGSIDWIIYAPELPDPVKGTLHVVVE